MPDNELINVMEIISTVGGVANLEPDRDFYDAGVTSVMALPLLMEMEDRFQVSIPDERFVQARTPRAIYEMITELRKG